MKENKYFKGWDNKSHLDKFNPWNYYSNSFFNYTFGSFYENKKILELIKKKNNIEVLDVGCASGYLLRYILKNVSGFNTKNYLGVDISKSAIEFAKKKYGINNFKVLDNENLIFNDNTLYDIVYSRDTILHQVNPIQFINKLLKLSKNYIVLRLRTRDKGKTEFNSEHSCQMHYDKYWMPYIVINIDELIEIFKMNAFIKEVSINKSYMTLGGQNYRFLPKDLYFSDSGTAETSIILKVDRSKNFTNILKINETSEKEGQIYIGENQLKFLIYRVLNKIGI